MSIHVTDSKSKMPEALKLTSKIISFLFEEQYGECRYMRESEVEALRKASRALQRASARTAKK